MATQVVDTDGHIFERAQDIAEYMEAPTRGRKDLLTLPSFRTLGGFQRMARRVGDGRPYVIGPDDPKSWFDVLDREGLDRAVIYPTAGLAEGFIQDADWAVVVCQIGRASCRERVEIFVVAV